MTGPGRIAPGPGWASCQPAHVVTSYAVRHLWLSSGCHRTGMVSRHRATTCSATMRGHQVQCALQVRDGQLQTLEADRRGSGMSTRTGGGSTGGGRSFAHDADGGSHGGSGISVAAPQASLWPTRPVAILSCVPDSTAQRVSCTLLCACPLRLLRRRPPDQHGLTHLVHVCCKSMAVHDHLLLRMQAGEHGELSPGELGHQDMRLRGDGGLCSQRDPAMPFLSGPPATLNWSPLHGVPLEVRRLLAWHAHVHAHPTECAAGALEQIFAALAQPYVRDRTKEHSNRLALLILVQSESCPLCGCH